jgi:hypothetical protein
MMDLAEKLDRRRQGRIENRVGWAIEVLENAGFQEVGFSNAHGISYYFSTNIGDWDSKNWDEDWTYEYHVRIRVSDHYAHPCRYDECNGQQIDFNVDIDPKMTRRQVERLVRQAIKEREEYLSSTSWQEVRNQLRKDRLECYPSLAVED